MNGIYVKMHVFVSFQESGVDTQLDNRHILMRGETVRCVLTISESRLDKVKTFLVGFFGMTNEGLSTKAVFF
jgi:hypothetical protein